MAWYRSGTVNVANGSASVVGAGTSFVANASIGEGFLGPDGRVYEIANVVSNTALTLASAYQGASANAQAYAILPTQSALADLAAEAAELVASFAAVRDGPGAGLFPDGTVGAPAIRFAADQDTGIYRTASNAMGFAFGGVLGLQMNSAGWLGVGTAPGSPFAAKLPNAGAATVGFSIVNAADADRGARLWVGTNGPMLDTNSGVVPLRFGVDNVEAARFIPGGNLGVNITAPVARLHVNAAAAMSGASSPGALRASTTGFTSEYLSIGNNSNTGAGMIQCARTVDSTAQEMLLNPYGGGVAIGRNDCAASGLHVQSGGINTIMETGSGDARTEFRVNGARIGLLSWQSGSVVLQSDTGHSAQITQNGIGIGVTSGGVRPTSDNALELGSPSLRWTQLFAMTSTVSTSDEREKTWRGELSDAEYEAGKRVIDELGFFQWNDALAEKGDNARYHFGARAQRVWGIFADAGLVDPIAKGKPGKTPYSFLCFDEWGDETRPAIGTFTRKAKRDVDTGEVYKSGERKGEPKYRTETYDQEYRDETGEQEVVVPAGNRFGLRTTDLALFLVAVQSRRQADIEKRLAALEKRAKA